MLNLLNFFGEGDSGSIIMLVVMGVLIVALLGGSFFMQKKQKKKAQETMSSLKVGDTIVTIGGVKGVIVAINAEDDTVIIETGNGTSITFFKGAIQAVNPQSAGQANAAAPKAEEAEAVEDKKDEE